MAAAPELVEFVSGLRYDDLPEEVVAKAKGLLLDSLGIQLASATRPWCRAVLRYVRGHGSDNGNSTLVTVGERMAPEAAALFNGICAHGFELDEMQPGAGVHCGCVIIPTALAMAEHQSTGGRDLLLWMVTGFEIMARIGIACSPSMLQRGHHGTGAVGTIAAASVAASALRLPPEEHMASLGIGAFQAAGLLEGTISGGELKRLSGGMAAANGIRAALLARSGLGAPQSMLDGELGFGNAFSDAFDASSVTSDLGSTWHILDSRYKWFAQDGFIQPMTQALSQLLRRQPLELERIEEIVVGTNAFATTITGTIREPTDVTGAQFSAPFSVALYLVRGGAGFNDYTEESLRDRRVRELSRRVRLVVDDELDRRLMWARGASVEVRMKDGRSYTERVDMLDPMPDEDLLKKYRRLATIVLDPAAADRLATSILSVERLPDITGLTQQLAPG